MNQKKAVILLSGGLDSATVVAMAKADGYACYTMSFDYGQRHRAELQAAARVARRDRAQGDRARPQWHGRRGSDRREHRGARVA